MELANSQRLPVTQQQAWEALNDPEMLKACIPGCDQIDRVSDTEYLIGMTAAVGPVKARFKGKLTLFDLNPPSSYSIKFDGQGGVAGFGSGMAKVELVPDAQQTVLNYNVTAQVGGRLAQVGSRLIDGTARKMADDFFGRFNEQVAQRFGAAVAEPPGSEPVGTTATEAAAFAEARSQPGARTASADAPTTNSALPGPSQTPPVSRDLPPISAVPLWLRLGIAVAMALLVFWALK
jgi:uncharacterized protein